MPQLKPKEKFVISRHLDDPIDANTYYVRAFIREKLSDTLIETVDLTDIGTGAGDQRFAKEWEVSSDPSGDGRWITITTKVYTNSIYTTLSNRYGVMEREYLVQERLSANLHYGGGGTDVSYEKIRKTIKEELARKKMKTIKLSPFFDRIEKNIIEKIADLYIPDIDYKRLEIDYKKIIKGLDLSAVLKKIDAIHPVDLLPVLDKQTKNTQSIKDEYEKSHKVILSEITEMRKLFKAIEDFKTMMLEKVKNVKNIPKPPKPPKDKNPVSRYFIGSKNPLMKYLQ